MPNPETPRDPVLFRLLPLVAWMLAVSIAVARGEDCKPPNVARAILFLGHATSELICPSVGLCYRVVDDTDQWSAGVVKIVCLTPDQHKAALERGR